MSKPIIRLIIATSALALVMLRSHRNAQSSALSDDAEGAFLPHANDPSSPESKISSSPVSKEFQLAYRESLGYFDDVPENQWLLRKRISAKRIHVAREYPFPRAYFQNNWNPDFSCDMEDYVGRRHPGKWVCDPHRLNRPGCLVYSVGSDGMYSFEKHLAEIAPLCEIHVFDLSNSSLQLAQHNISNAVFHPWGIIDAGKQYFRLKVHAIQRNNEFKTLTETMKSLGHIGRTLNLFKVVCEQCEYFAVNEWLQHDIRQLLVEAYRKPRITTPFFEAMHEKGYVITHKEPDVLLTGEVVEFVFLKMDPSFRNVSTSTR